MAIPSKRIEAWQRKRNAIRTNKINVPLFIISLMLNVWCWCWKLYICICKRKTVSWWTNSSLKGLSHFIFRKENDVKDYRLLWWGHRHRQHATSISILIHQSRQCCWMKHDRYQFRKRLNRIKLLLLPLDIIRRVQVSSIFRRFLDSYCRSIRIDS